MRLMRGFTLVELMVTIAVLAIIATMAAPSFRNMIARQQLNSTTHELKDLLTTARSQAVLLRTNTSVRLNSSNSNSATQLNWSPISGNQLIFPNGSSLTSIAFNTNGTVSSINSDTQLQICNTQLAESEILVLSKMGTISLLDNQAGACS
ncbi:prepilin-type N-terminal cleavage/methylation domain-containing protein [Acinetobacter sp.]|uniref:pilus assembly FimT family protein n=1 Tax=Acinetobacter sp. TaxID=472 RepID=UPI0031D36661